MKHIVTTGIVLKRTEFREADRILQVMTSDNGKVSLIAKGVRKPKSRLAGGIELFAINDLTYIPGKGSISTVTSSRVLQHFGNIVKDYDRTMYAYSSLKNVDKLTEDTAGSEYFELLGGVLAGLDDADLTFRRTRLWMCIRLLTISGNVPNLLTDADDNPLKEGTSYVFDFSRICFVSESTGVFTPAHIKLLRFCVNAKTPLVLKNVQSAEEVVDQARLLAQSLVGDQLGVEL
ncbi:hypothetical protein BH23PAT2_BH23PAT2_01880 [soil metagenome]